MMKSLGIILFSIITCSACSQAIVERIVEFNYVSKFYTTSQKERYEFPRVILPNNKKISNKINKDLTADFLDLDTSKMHKSIFENVWATEEEPMGILHDISYEVKANNKNFISLAISAEGCGAYCENFTQYFSYALKSGNRILLEDLFNNQGKFFILRSLTRLRKNNMVKQIQDAKDSLKIIRIKRDKDASEYYRDMIDLYTKCIAEKVISDFDLNFYLTKSQLTIIPERCSAHYNRNIDELEGAKYVFTFRSLRKNLSPFALKLIKE